MKITYRCESLENDLLEMILVNKKDLNSLIKSQTRIHPTTVSFTASFKQLWILHHDIIRW
jgi:hypothetical protein